MPEITKTLYVKNAAQWRKWLQENYKKESEIWLELPHKDTGRQKIVYNDSVEEALCFGWIDGTVKSYGPDASVQRFTPRRPKSPYSQMNKERIKVLAEEGKLKPEVKQAVQDILAEKYVFPKDIIAAIKENPQAWEHYNTFSERYRRIRVAYINDNRPYPELFEKALNNFIKKTAQGKQFGYGGIDKYF